MTTTLVVAEVSRVKYNHGPLFLYFSDLTGTAVAIMEQPQEKWNEPLLISILSKSNSMNTSHLVFKKAIFNSVNALILVAWHGTRIRSP